MKSRFATRAARPRLWVLTAAVAAAACDSPASADKGGAPASPTAAPSIPSKSPAADAPCHADEDCTRPWTPARDGCGALARCVDGACLEPAATTGLANGTTGRIALESTVGERSYQVEVVRSAFETQRGLMCRPSMRADWGMLFLFEASRPQAFWMKNTLIPLDMVFIRDDWTIAGIVSDAPPRTLEPRGVSQPSRYVLELVAGEARRVGLAVGGKVRFYGPRGD